MTVKRRKVSLMAKPTHQRMAMLARIREEARLDRLAEDMYADFKEDQRDEEFHRYDDRY
jgi:hypothetical protein